MVEEANNQSLKRIRAEEMVEKEGEDRISALPDGLLLEILSRIPSTKSSIRTGTLSKRWKHLWTWVPTLIINEDDYDLTSSDFISMVNKTLTQLRQSKLRKFAVNNTYCDLKLESEVNNWIPFAMSRKVEELDLRIGDVDNDVGLPLNEEFYINSCFTNLTLEGYMFNPSGAISWKRLKRLCIAYGNLGFDLIERILAGSPMLESVELEQGYGTWRLGIRSKSIKRLELSDNRDDYDDYVSEVYNWIQYGISCSAKELDLRLYRGDWKDNFMLPEDIFISSCLKYLSLYGPIFNPNGAISWGRLRSLYISVAKLDENMIENILSGSPLLETLGLGDCHYYTKLDITSKSIKELVIARHGDLEGKFEIAKIINAPYIESLTIQGFLPFLEFSLSNVSSLVEANLDITMSEYYDKTTFAEEEMLNGFIRSLRHVKELNIEDCYYKVMLEKCKEAILEEYKQDRDLERVLMSSTSLEVQQLKEKIQKMEHEHVEQEVERKQLKEKIQKMEYERAEQEAVLKKLKEKIKKMEHEQAEQEAEREQLKEKIQKMKHDQREHEAKRVMQEAEQKAKRVVREAEQKAKQVVREAEEKAKRAVREAQREAKRVMREAGREAKRVMREADREAQDAQ